MNRLYQHQELAEFEHLPVQFQKFEILFFCNRFFESTVHFWEISFFMYRLSTFMIAPVYRGGADVEASDSNIHQVTSRNSRPLSQEVTSLPRKFIQKNNPSPLQRRVILSVPAVATTNQATCT